MRLIFSGKFGMVRCSVCGTEFVPARERQTLCSRKCASRKGNAARDASIDTRNRKWEQANPDKRRAQKAVENALAWGRMTRKPCERCGADKAHAHHDDYSKPLDVTWLCPKHHKERHRELEAQAESEAA